MAKDLISNIPSRKAAIAAAVAGPRQESLPLTPLVRGALDAVYAVDELYEQFMAHFDEQERSITGSKRVDGYYAADMLASLDNAHSVELRKLLDSGKIKLIDIAKRLVPELRKRNLMMRGNVCLGIESMAE